MVSWSVGDAVGGGGGKRLGLEARFAPGASGNRRLPCAGQGRAPAPAPAQAPSYTLAFRADGAALARGDFGVGTVLDFVADHVIAQHVAVVADTDLAGHGFPHVSVMVPEAVLYAGDWWDWGKRGRWGLSSARESPTSGLQVPQPHRSFPSVLDAHLDFPFPASPFFVFLFFLSPNP